jgi:hypothetical protein
MHTTDLLIEQLIGLLNHGKSFFTRSRSHDTRERHISFRLSIIDFALTITRIGWIGTDQNRKPV